MSDRGNKLGFDEFLRLSQNYAILTKQDLELKQSVYKFPLGETVVFHHNSRKYFMSN
jgi:hypothetical protein